MPGLLALATLALSAVSMTIAEADAQREVTCEGSCVSTWKKCGGRGITQHKPCCSPDDACFQRNSHFAQCRPKNRKLPASWTSGEVVKCGAKSPAPAAGAVTVKKSDGADGAPASEPVAADVCGDVFKSGVQFDPKTDCAVPNCKAAVPQTTAGSADACLQACNDEATCSCSVYSAGAGSCDMYWPSCGSAILAMAGGSDSGNTALKSCAVPVNVTALPTPASTHSKCDPFELYPGVMVTRFGCTAPMCQHSVAPEPAPSLDDCLAMCKDAGYARCKTATYDPTAKKCHMYTQRLKEMGAHASAAVHVEGGLGVVTASYCAPPSNIANYPDVPTSKFGVDWKGLCSDAAVESVVVPHQIHKCDDCQIFPASRTDREIGSLAAFYYRSNGLDECQADCEAEADCACAYFRLDDQPEPDRGVSWCALTNVPCENAEIGATFDATQTHSAIHKCGFEVTPEIEESWPDEAYDWIDWYGIWDFVCESPEPFEYRYVNTHCGPDCVLAGEPTTIEKDSAACAARCMNDTKCGCSYYEPKRGLCTLMWGGDADANGMGRDDSVACKANSWEINGSMHHQVVEGKSNFVTEICCHNCMPGDY